MKLAYRLMDDTVESWEPVDFVDHRTLQHAHDILAAVWRFVFEIKLRQLELPGIRPCQNYYCPSRIEGRTIFFHGLRDGKECPAPYCDWLRYKEEPDFVGHWLNWLKKEVNSWKRDPHLIRLVMRILRNQNQTLGYEAEDELEDELKHKYYEDNHWSDGEIPRIGVGFPIMGKL